MDKAILEIIEILDKGDKVSTKTGKPYTIAKVKDGKTGRIATAFGAWTKGWKVGDTVEVIWKSNDYNGQTQWNVESPTAGPRTGGAAAGGFTSRPNIVVAYQIAAALAPIYFADKAPKIGEITKLAKSVLKELESEQPAPAPVAAPVAEEAAPAKKKKAKEVEPEEEEEEEVEEEEDEDELF